MDETMSRTQRSLGERGFTLIELVIAVAIIGILAAIAFPSFMNSVRKSRRTDAVTALNNVQQAQERYRANKTTYADNLTAAPNAAPPPSGLGLTTTTAGGYYTIALVSATATSYEATATAVSGSSQANDTNCAKLGVRMTNATLEYAGTTSAGTLTYAATSPCWSR